MSTQAALKKTTTEAAESLHFFNPSHWRAFDGIREGVLARAGIMVLTGPMGSGKSLIMRLVSEELESELTCVFLRFSDVNFKDFIHLLDKSLLCSAHHPEAPNKAEALKAYLRSAARRGNSVVVMIDDAQNMTDEVLTMLPRLSRIETLQGGLPVGLQFVLAGSRAFQVRLSEPRWEKLRREVSQVFQLRFYSRKELTVFIKQRTEALARRVDPPITRDAIDRIGDYTAGSPRLTSMILGHTMLFASEKGVAINSRMVDEAAQALMIDQKRDAFEEEEKSLTQSLGPHAVDDDWNEEEPETLIVGPQAMRQPQPIGRMVRKAFEMVCDIALRRNRDAVTSVNTEDQSATKRNPARRGPRRVRTVRVVDRSREKRWLKRGLAAVAVIAAVVFLAPVAMDAFSNARARVERAVAESIALAERQRAQGAAAPKPEESPTNFGVTDVPRRPQLPSVGSDAPPAPDRVEVLGRAEGALASVESKGRELIKDLAAPESVRNAAEVALGYVASAREKVSETRRNEELLKAGPEAVMAHRTAEAARLVSEGESHYAAERLTAPAGQNAYAAFREALLLDPGNAAALAGVTRIRDHYVALAQDARNRGNFPMAAEIYDKVVAIEKLEPLE